MRTRCVLLVLVAVSVLLLGSCNFGGQGADFDATQYYTKTNINTWMQNALPSSTNAAGFGASITPSNNTYASGASCGSLPSGAAGVFLVVWGTTTSTTLYVGDSDSNSSAWTIPALTGNSAQLVWVNLRPSGSAYTGTVKLWATPAVSGTISAFGVLKIYDWNNGQP